MKQTFSEEQLTQALQSLKVDTSDERFLMLTSEAQEHQRFRPLLWYGIAASAAILIAIGCLWPLMKDETHRATPPASAIVIDDNLSQLVNQSLNAQTEAQEQRTRTSTLVSEHQSLVLQP